MKKKIIFILVVFLITFSCNFSVRKFESSVGKGGINGDISPQEMQTCILERPKGMQLIPSGSFVIGQSDQDFTFNSLQPPLKTISVSAFYMDETEVTNSQYRFFVNYVRDSIARTLLAERVSAIGSVKNIDNNLNGSSIQDYSFLIVKEKNNNPYLEFLSSYEENRDNDIQYLNWNVPLHWNVNNYPDVEYAEVMEELYIPKKNRIDKERTFNTAKLVYRFFDEDRTQIAVKRIKNKDYNSEELSINIYPDTTVWIRDFNYSHNEPMFERYFWHKAFNDYPVVGVTFDQAKAFCSFRTKFKNDYNSLKNKKKEKIFSFRLPTEAEWEYAARGMLKNAPYPWGGPYLRDDRGCYMANFKPERGNYFENKNGYLYTSKVKTFHKNGYGLYDMSGNIAEWTLSPYNNSSYLISSSMNPYLGSKIKNQVKVIRGGSWKDVGYMLMVSSRDFEHKDSARSYIGFRCVQSVPEGAFLKRRTN